MAELMVDETAIEKINVETGDVEAAAEHLEISRVADLELGSFLLTGIKGLIKEADNLFGPNIKRWNQGHKEAIADLKKIKGPLLEAERTVKGKVAAYHMAQRRLADEARRVEAKRLADLEEERRLRAAVALEERGQQEKADAMIEAPAPVAPAPLITTPPPPKVKGISTSEKHTGRVVGIREFVEYVLDTSAFSEYFQLKQGALDRTIQKAKGKIEIPGVEIKTETVVASRSTT